MRPLANLVARKIAAAMMRRAIRGTMNPASKIWCMLFHNLFLGILPLGSMSCMSYYDGRRSVLDWPVFFGAVHLLVVYQRGLPARRPPRSQRLRELGSCDSCARRRSTKL